jgi:FKBP-type peptidyl-prolyl cis-trans isomerase FklB
MRAYFALVIWSALSLPLLAQAPKQPPSAQRQAPSAQRQPPSAQKQLPAAGQPVARGTVDPAEASYVLGYTLATNFARDKVPLDAKRLVAGIQDGLAGAKAPMTEEEMEALLSTFFKELRAHANEQSKADGEAFLTANAKAPGVKTTKSGLQYKVLKEGTGKSPKATDTVTTHYKGTLIDGSTFDSSYDRNEPASFPVNGVIKGWTEALQMMKEGSKWQLFIPSDLAYGPQGRPPVIPANATLVFEVELLKVGE